MACPPLLSSLPSLKNESQETLNAAKRLRALAKPLEAQPLSDQELRGLSELLDGPGLNGLASPLAALELQTQPNQTNQQRSNAIAQSCQDACRKFKQTLDTFFMVLPQTLQVNQIPVLDQFSYLFDAYEYLRDAFHILRSILTDQPQICELNNTMTRLIDDLQFKLLTWLNSEVYSFGKHGPITATSLSGILKAFQVSIDLIKKGSLENWRREQKRNMLGINVIPNEFRESMQLLQITQKGFQYMFKIWQQLNASAHYWTEPGMRAQIFNECKVLLQTLLQSSFVVEWSMCGCGERKEHKRRSNYVEQCRKRFQPPTVIHSGAAVDEDKVTVIPKILAIGPDDSPNVTVQFRLSLIRPTKCREFNALKEDIAVKLRDNLFDGNSVSSEIERGGKISGDDEQSADGTVLSDGSLGCEFSNLTMTLAGSNKRVAQQDDNENQLPQMGKGAAAGRKAETKYHMQLTAAVGLFNNTEEIKLKTISTPFMISVNAQQFSQITKAMFWSVLASAPNSVTFTEEEGASIVWGELKPAIKSMFYKLTMSRELRDEEVDHIGHVIFKLSYPLCKGAEFKLSPLTRITLKDIQNVSYRHSDSNTNQKESNDTNFSFWDWYFSAIEMINDKNSRLLPTKMAPKDPLKAHWRTMSGLFRSGVIYGFIGRDEAMRILASCPESAMLLRISDHISASLTVSCYRKNSSASGGKFDHIPLSRQLLGNGLPELLAKLTQLEGIDIIIVHDPDYGTIYEEKRSLIGTLGPIVNRYLAEYYSSYLKLMLFANESAMQDVQNSISVKPTVPLSDVELRNLMNSLGPENCARLVALIQNTQTGNAANEQQQSPYQ